MYALFDPGYYETHFDEVTNMNVTMHVRTLPWFSYFWFDTKNTPQYEIAFFYQIWCITLYGILIGTADALVAGMLVHLNAQFSILRNSVLTLRERAIKFQVCIFSLFSKVQIAFRNGSVAIYKSVGLTKVFA